METERHFVDTFYAPVLVFAYNRANHLRRTLQALSANVGVENTKIYVHVDGPKTEDEEITRDEVLSVLEEFKSGLVDEVLIQHTNKGLSRSVIDGVSEMFERHDRLIVLEDDIVSSSAFLEYMNRCLSIYEHSPKIMSVSAYLPDRISREVSGRLSDGDVFLVQRSSSWGWGTWRKSWEKADWFGNENGFHNATAAAKRVFGRLGRDLIQMVELQTEGLIDSWAIRWAWAHYRNGSFALTPVRSLVENIGFDGSGTHTRRKLNLGARLSEPLTNLSLPETPLHDLYIDDVFYKNHNPSIFRTLYWKARIIKSRLWENNEE